jgi:hypothetical protein
MFESPKRFTEKSFDVLVLFFAALTQNPCFGTKQKLIKKKVFCCHLMMTTEL